MNIVSAVEVSVREYLLWSCQAAVLVSIVWLILCLDRPHRPKERYKVWFTNVADYCGSRKLDLSAPPRDGRSSTSAHAD